jgi:hypothetical protein
MLRRVTLIRTDASENRTASIIRVTRIGEPESLAVTSNRSRLRKNVALERADVPLKRWFLEPRGVNIPEDGIHHSHRRENLRRYIITI